MSLTDKEIAVVMDTVNDANTTEYLTSPIDIFGPIDFDVLKAEIDRLGPLRMRSGANPYSVEIHMSKCACEDLGCTEDIITVIRRNGVFAIRWMLSQEELLDFDSIEQLKQSVLAGYFLDTCLERQAIEQDVERVLGKHYMDVEPVTCFCEACADAVGKDALPLHMLLSQLAANLTARLEHIEESCEVLGEDAEEYINTAFDLGYQVGRLYSEYQVKRDIEGDALIGRAFEKLKRKRSTQAGAKSAVKRLERMQSMMEHMEQLASTSPALLRVGADNLARLACEDAIAADPALWSQGGGQIAEYLGEIRRGEAGKELKKRLAVLFPSKPH